MLKVNTEDLSVLKNYPGFHLFNPIWNGEPKAGATVERTCCIHLQSEHLLKELFEVDLSVSLCFCVFMSALGSEDFF